MFTWASLVNLTVKNKCSCFILFHTQCMGVRRIFSREGKIGIQKGGKKIFNIVFWPLFYFQRGRRKTSKNTPCFTRFSPFSVPGGQMPTLSWTCGCPWLNGLLGLHCIMVHIKISCIISFPCYVLLCVIKNCIWAVNKLSTYSDPHWGVFLEGDL